MADRGEKHSKTLADWGLSAWFVEAEGPAPTPIANLLEDQRDFAGDDIVAVRMNRKCREALMREVEVKVGLGGYEYKGIRIYRDESVKGYQFVTREEHERWLLGQAIVRGTWFPW